MRSTICIISVLSLFSANAFAGIIGLVWSHAGSNVIIKGATVDGQPMIQVQIPMSPNCPINLYRDAEDSEFSGFD